MKQFGVAVDNVFSLLNQHGTANAFQHARLLPADAPPHALSVLALEHVLRVQALMAEVMAGMWRRNGVEMWAQSVTYRSVHCSELMLDTGALSSPPPLASCVSVSVVCACVCVLCRVHPSHISTPTLP